MSTEADFWTPDGWRRAPMPDAAQRALSNENDWHKGLADNGYQQTVRFGNTDDYETLVSVNVHKHLPTGHFFVEIWGGDYSMAEFFVDPPFCSAFITDKLAAIVHSYGLHDQQAVAGELRVLRKAFAAFVRHEHGTHVLDEDGDQTLEERRDAAERQRWRRQQQEEAKKAKLAAEAAQ